jgi:hypothetical protein
VRVEGAMAVGRWPKEGLVAGHFCGLTPTTKAEPNHRENIQKQKSFFYKNSSYKKVMNNSLLKLDEFIF